jgi:GMP synthase-like glutamine amidotransferase
MKRAVILQHVPHEGPARLAPLLSQLGYELELVELYRGAPIPALSRDELLIVMGGPMGVGDVERPKYPFLRRELDLLAQRIRDDAPTLGICLGSQLIASAAGARVYAMKSESGARRYEVGWAPVTFHREQSPTLFEGIPDQVEVLHLHGDTFDLPAGARLLASTPVCRNQAFQLGRRVFGLQFHAEITAANVEEFLEADSDFVLRANGAGAVEALRRDTARCMDAYSRLGDRWLGNLLSAMIS